MESRSRRRGGGGGLTFPRLNPSVHIERGKNRQGADPLDTLLEVYILNNKTFDEFQLLNSIGP